MTRAGLRRALHVASGVFVFPMLIAPPFASRSLVFAAAVAALAVDVVRIRSPAIRATLSRALPVFRPSEDERLSGGSWLMLGYAAAAVFPASAAAAGIVVAALADPVAASVGERFGDRRAKSWPGTAAALAAGWVALAVMGLPVHVVFVAGLVGAASERMTVAVDDNLVVAPAVGATVALLG